MHSVQNYLKSPTCKIGQNFRELPHVFHYPDCLIWLLGFYSRYHRQCVSSVPVSGMYNSHFYSAGPSAVNPLCSQQGKPLHDECDLAGNQLSLAASHRGDRWAGDCSQPCPIKVPPSGKVIAVVAFALVRW